MRTVLALLLLSAPAFAAKKAPKELNEDITVKARAAGAAGVQVAPPAASKPVIDEVLKSLSLGRGARAPAAERIRTGGDVARFLRPYPESPFLALSPANIVALYDQWSFEVVDSEGEIVWKSDGVGVLQDKIDWDGTGPDGRLTIVAGRSYHYRFTGSRAGRSFVIESDPVPLKSFTHREYAGETRLEADIGLFFESGKAESVKGADEWIDALARRLRSGEPRADGNYKIELAMKDLRSPLAKGRAKLLSRKLAKALVVSPERVVVSLMPALRGEAVSGFTPPSKGAALRIE